MDITYFQKIQGSYGVKSKREKDLAKINYKMEKHFEDTFDTEEVLINKEPSKLMIIKDTDGNTFKKKIKAKHNDKFNLGDYVVWNNQHWLITLIDSDEKTWNRGYMYLCTILLRWQNLDGKIIERWCYSEDFTKYSSGVDGNSTITLGDNQYGLTIPVDEDTKILKRDIRFPIDFEDVLEPDIYILTNKKGLLNDNQSFGRGGLIKLTLSYDTFNKEKDKLVTLNSGKKVWIADYKTPFLSPFISPIPDHLLGKNAILHIEGHNTVKVGRSSIYTAVVKDLAGTEVTNCEIKWNIICDFIEDITIISDGKIMTLQINNSKLISRTFSIHASANANVIGELVIEIVGFL